MAASLQGGRMKSITPQKIKQQIDHLTGALIELGICDDQNAAVLKKTSAKGSEIAFLNSGAASVALKDRDYDDIYMELLAARAYNLKLLDGALVQMIYEFNGRTLTRHRLAFFPSPTLEPFQQDPDLYFQDVLFLEIVSRRIVPFPVRFDFDGRDGVHRAVEHPKSHLTLGHYEHCRIPVTSPLTPYWLIDFLLRNFYHSAFDLFADRLPRDTAYFEESIVPAERGVVHVCVPTGSTV
jgi:hypothetical protein